MNELDKYYNHLLSFKVDSNKTKQAGLKIAAYKVLYNAHSTQEMKKRANDILEKIHRINFDVMPL